LEKVLLRIRYRIVLVVGVAATLGQIATATFFARQHEQTVMAQHELAMRDLTDSVNQSLQSVMLAGSADIAQAFAARLKRTPDVLEFRIMRRDGMEAFGDNKTILEVNRRRGDDVFALREQENPVKVMERLDSDFQNVLSTGKPVSIYAPDTNGNPTLTFLAPVLNSDACYKCHGKADPIRGVIRLTTSLAPTEREILKARQQSLAVLVSSLAITLLLISYMLGRIVIRPIETVTRAMGRIAEGDLEHKVKTTPPSSLPSAESASVASRSRWARTRPSRNSGVIFRQCDSSISALICLCRASSQTESRARRCTLPTGKVE
jgi:hypothetical protein